MSPGRRVVVTNDVDAFDGGVFVLRAWMGPDNEIVARVQWSIHDDEQHEYALGANAIIRAVHTFLHQVDDRAERDRRESG